MSVLEMEYLIMVPRNQPQEQKKKLRKLEIKASRCSETLNFSENLTSNLSIQS